MCVCVSLVAVGGAVLARCVLCVLVLLVLSASLPLCLFLFVVHSCLRAGLLHSLEGSGLLARRSGQNSRRQVRFESSKRRCHLLEVTTIERFAFIEVSVVEPREWLHEDVGLKRQVKVTAGSLRPPSHDPVGLPGATPKSLSHFHPRPKPFFLSGGVQFLGFSCDHPGEPCTQLKCSLSLGS